MFLMSLVRLKIGDSVRVNEKAPGDYQGRVGVIIEVPPGRSECRVLFEEESGKALDSYLDAHWLDQVQPWSSGIPGTEAVLVS